VTLRHRIVPASQPGTAEQCTLTREDGERRSPALSTLFAQLTAQEETPRGNVFVFSGDPDVLWRQVSRFVDEEAQCCPFYEYEMTEEPGGVRLLVSKPPLQVNRP
jgi:hypothetical protein